MNVVECGLKILYNYTSPPPAKYHGLLNQGATCYLNSVLQVLFMTEEFREAVERHIRETPDPIDHHLKQLFDVLKRGTANTFKITKRLGIVRVYEQCDAAEYFEKILSLTSSEASQIFRGLLTHKYICSQCRTEKDNDERFWHLPLALVNSFGKEVYSVVNGVEEYFRPSVFSGVNQMYCDECDAKSDATNKCVIKHHPEVLMLLLKRFVFDYSYMSYVKINRTVDIPYTLQIPENQTYELYAIVDHVGNLRSGHYTATIKDDKSWYRFDDHRVTLLDYQPFQADNFEKSSSAYLLFYRNEQSEKKRKSSTIDSNVKHLDNEQKVSEDLVGTLEVGQYRGLKPVSVDKQEDVKRMKMDITVDMKGETGADERGMASGREKLHRSYNEFPGNGGVGDSEQNMPKEYQGCEHRSSSRYKKHEQQREKLEKEQKRGDDNGQDVEDQNNEGLDDIRQNQSEQKITDAHTRHKDVCVVKQAKEQEDEHIQNRADSPVRRAGSSGSRRLTENQGVSRVEKTRHGDSQPRAVGRSPEPCFNVEVQDNGVYARESKPIKHQERNEEMNDFRYLQDVQAVKQRDEGEKMMDDEEDMGGNAEAGKKEPSSSETQLEESAEDQDNEGLDYIRQNQSEQKITDTHTRHKDVCVVKQAKEQEDEHIQNRADSPVRRAGSPGSRRLTENQGVSRVEKTRHGDSPPRAVGRSPEPCFNVEVQDNGVYARESKPIKHQERNEEMNNLSNLQDTQTVKQSEEGEKMMDDEEDMGGNAEAGKKEPSSRETQLEESAEDQNNDSERLDVRQRRPDINHDYKDGKTGDNEYLNSNVEHPDNEQNISEDLGGTQEVGQDYGLKPVSVEKQEDEKRKKMDIKVDMERETGADERGMASGREKLHRSYNEFPGNGGVGDSEQNMPKEYQECEHRSSSRYKKHEQQTKEKRDVKGAKEQKRGDDNCQDVEDENTERLDDIRQSCSEKKITIRHTRHNNVCVVKQAKEQEDEHIQNRADSPVRRAGSTGSRRLTENQGFSRVEKKRRGDSQPRARTGFNEDTIKGRRGSEKSRPGENVKRKSDPKTDAEVSLSESVHNLKLSEGPLEEPQKHKTKRVTGNTQEENETNSTVHPNARTKRKVSDTQEQDAEMKHVKKKSKWCRVSASQKKHTEDKSKQNKPTGCLPFSCKNYSSDSD